MQKENRYWLEARIRLAGIVDSDGSAERLRPPEQGFIRWVREGRGETLEEVAKRMGITFQSLAQMERNEMEGTIGIEALRRAALALDCTVVYALVPNGLMKKRVTPGMRKQATDLLAERRARRNGEAGRPIRDPIVIWEGEKSPL